MNSSLTNAAALAGRILLALIFLQSGFGKLTGFSGTVGYIASKGIPFPEIAAAGALAVEMLGAILLIVGWKARWAAAAIFLFLIPVTYVFHNPTGLPADQVQTQMIQLMKNISIMGGMLMVVAFGPGAWSLDDRNSTRSKSWPRGAASNA
jgi:putative oxidoreductase